MNLEHIGHAIKGQTLGTTRSGFYAPDVGEADGCHLLRSRVSSSHRADLGIWASSASPKQTSKDRNQDSATVQEPTGITELR